MNTINVPLNDVWDKVKTSLRDSNNMDANLYTTFIEETELAQLSDTADILVQNSVQKIILNDYLDDINTIMNTLVGKDNIICELHIKSDYKVKEAPAVQVPQYKEIVRSNGISSEQSFDSFVVGPSNKESHSASLACAYKPGKYYTPLFIYGNSGLGKTHLLNAIGNFILDKNPDAKVLYTSSSDFVRQVATSIGNRTIEDFKEQMYNLDVLLIDDIQFLAGKEKSHEIFFHIFNELIFNKKQIVITSDTYPTEIKGLEDRLISRFSSGLSVGVDKPEFETALAILELKIRQRMIDQSIFDHDVLAYIASNYSNDVRMLDGILNRLLFFSIEFSQNERINMDIAMKALKGNSEAVKTTTLDSKTIKRVVADYYGLTQAQLVSKARTKAIANARHIAIYLCRKHLDLPYIRIGDDFGKRDHSTIISACDKIEKNLIKDPLLAKAIYELELKFQ